ncbi:MAG: hypothetical protein HRT35_28950 [Algicola sp.]|nr:hypothetical protein [Algicola sp.]
MLNKHFTLSLAQMDHKFTEAKNTRYGRSHYSNPCFFLRDNHWKQGVVHLAELSKVALVDLRGVTAKNVGITYELDFLVDRYNLQHALFLFDDTTDVQCVHDALQTSWACMLPDSPNRLNPPACLNFYRFHHSPEKEMVVLLQWLCELSEDPIAVGSVETAVYQ